MWHRAIWGPLGDLLAPLCVVPPSVSSLPWRHACWLHVACCVAIVACRVHLQTTSYQPPTVTGLSVTGFGAFSDEPDGVPTAGGALVVVQGTGFGPTPSLIRISWGEMSVEGVVLAVRHTRVTFPSPPGTGPPVFLTLSVAGQLVYNQTGTGAPLRLKCVWVEQGGVSPFVPLTLFEHLLARSMHGGGVGARGLTLRRRWKMCVCCVVLCVQLALL
jgi:hypothetical protein